ncbi:MAG: dihydrodipicolinate synthase family protein [Thermoguttaceae bacterium]
MAEPLSAEIGELLRRGLVIPASPLALNSQRRWDQRRQLGLWRYYAAAGAGGIAVGVHTTQFAIREPKIGLLGPLLALAAEEFDRLDARRREPLVRIAGICGRTEQAVAEAAMARQLRFHLGLLSLGAMREADEDALVAHCHAVAEILPLMGFYLQPAVGGRVLPYGFWRRLAEIENVAAIKIAPFNRYQTLDVVRAVAESGREDIALYTGNDDNIVLDLLTPYCFSVEGRTVCRRIVGGLLGHWAVWTRRAVELLETCHAAVAAGGAVPAGLLRRAAEVTDANAALFDVAHQFAGCIAGIHEVLRRQGLLEGIWCLDPAETLSPGQSAEIDRVLRMYPHLNDDAFVAEHRDQWLK